MTSEHLHDTDSAETGWCSGCGSTGLTVTAPHLTSRDVERALADDRHHGWGLAVAQDLPERSRARLLAEVARQAEALAWSREMLFQFTDSKPARHMVDDASFARTAGDLRRVVAAYVNDSYMALILEDLARG